MYLFIVLIRLEERVRFFEVGVIGIFGLLVVGVILNFSFLDEEECF